MGSFDQVTELKDEARDRISKEFDSLKGSFNQLRSDVTSLLQSAVGVGKTSVGAVKNQATHAVDDVKTRLNHLEDQGKVQAQAIGHRIEENPLATAVIALAAGFIIAKLLTKK